MPSRTRATSTSVGTKLLIGATGLFLVIYLLIHIVGNLIVFLGPSAFNKYAYTLESVPILPAIEIILLVGFLLHIFKTVGMFLSNQQARPVKYAMKRNAGAPSRKTFASSTMILSGLWLVVFLLIHVKAFRFSPMYDWAEGGHDLYRLEIDVFRNPLMVGFYVITMLLVGSHLWHGSSSAFQSLGIDDRRWTPRVIIAGKAFAVLVAGGFITIALWAHFIGGQP
jgi:succinate dehydrogenase / fumarate reductase cytochrome b subunit